MAPWMKVSPIGMIVAALSYIVIGVVFYSHWGLGRYWEEHVKHMHLKVLRQNIKAYLGAVACALVIAYFMGCIQNIIDVEDVITGVFIGFLIWLGFILPTIFSPVLFGKKPIQVFWLDALYYFLAYIVIGGITAWYNIIKLV